MGEFPRLDLEMPTRASTPGAPSNPLDTRTESRSPAPGGLHGPGCPTRCPAHAMAGFHPQAWEVHPPVTVPWSASRGYSARQAVTVPDRWLQCPRPARLQCPLWGLQCRVVGYGALFRGYSARLWGYGARFAVLGGYSALDARDFPACRATAIVLFEPGWQMDGGKTPARSPGAGRPNRRGVTVP